MFRPIMLLSAVGILAWCEASQRPLDICSAVFCASVSGEDCHGEYLPWDPPERCCSMCTVYKDVNESCVRNQFPIVVKCKHPYVCKNDVCAE